MLAPSTAPPILAIKYFYREQFGINLQKNCFDISASQRVSGDAKVPLVPGAGDLRPGDVHQAEGAQGDVGGQDHEEQDHQLRA